jgi:hypothetical protein
MARLSSAVVLLNRTARKTIASLSTAVPHNGIMNLSVHQNTHHVHRLAASQKLLTNGMDCISKIRLFSTLPPATSSNSPGNVSPPTSLSAEAGLKAQDAMRLFIEHGIGKRTLESIAQEKVSFAKCHGPLTVSSNFH